MKKIIAIIILVITLVSGCSNNDIFSENTVFNELKNEYDISANSIDAVLNELKHKKIVLFGESHVTVNEQLFISNNIKKLYDAGVRYLFVEGGVTLDDSLPGGANYYFYMFYPWMEVGWRYETLLLFQSITEINNSVPVHEQIKVICPEPPDPDSTVNQVMNYRDSNSAKNIISIMDNTDDNVKAIMIFGSAHGSTDIYEKYADNDSEEYDWIPLGYRLKQHYEEQFSSYMFYYFPSIEYITESRLVLTKNLSTGMERLKCYDGFIVEPEIFYGTLYQYNPTNENLQYIFNVVENYAIYNRNNIPDTTYMIWDPQGQFLMGLYYLKLYFKEKFDYQFWKTAPSKELLTALDELKTYAFNGNNPSDFIGIHYNYDNIVLYHNYMMDSDIAGFLENQGDDIQEAYLLQALELFPEDVWTLFWLGFAAAEKKQYAKALGFFQALFENELVACMENLPLAYQKAAFCSEKLKNKVLYEEYTSIYHELYNEYGINTEGYYNTGYYW